jgi:UDP-2,3-diacylglucosamine pyrophosphatase LpxH
LQKFLRKILLKPVLSLTKRFSGSPEKKIIFKALNELQQNILDNKSGKGKIIPFDLKDGSFIIFSDAHKGGGDNADDFMQCEDNYLGALQYYHHNGFHFISLGDSEELWETTLAPIKKVHPKSFESEKQFIPANAFTKIYGNHDLYWSNDPFAGIELKKIYGRELQVFEGVILTTFIDDIALNIFCTHGHQGDKLSDGNWFSKFFVARIWAPFQAYLNINPNTPAYDSSLKNKHNQAMYEWTINHKNILLVTGHTHQPVFASLTHLERLFRDLLICRNNNDQEGAGKTEKEIEIRKHQYQHISEDYLSMLPTYFNSGCCCYDDGDITGLEIDKGCIRLIKWSKKSGVPTRKVLEEVELRKLIMA